MKKLSSVLQCHLNFHKISFIYKKPGFETQGYRIPCQVLYPIVAERLFFYMSRFYLLIQKIRH